LRARRADFGKRARDKLLRRRNSIIALLVLGSAFLAPLNLLAASCGKLCVQVCDPIADFYLGQENYPEAIQHHRQVLQQHPENALAYYHLGFAYGMVGDHRRELDDYQKAVDLGLSNWDLFLNMGLVYLENGRLDSASEVLQLATFLAPFRPETHFNLGLLDERMGMFQQAQQEILLSLTIDPNQNDARNTLGVIYAEQGNFEQAHQEWSDLIRSHPDYAPARANLRILNRIERGEVAGTTRLTNGFAEAR
jgi:tetratricopeptide (TPR) repeat protein